jgi:hypothetical protein
LPPCRFDSLYTTSNPPENVNLCFLWILGARKFYYYYGKEKFKFFLAVVTVADGKVETRSGTTLQAEITAAPVLENRSTQK